MTFKSPRICLNAIGKTNLTKNIIAKYVTLPKVLEATSCITWSLLTIIPYLLIIVKNVLTNLSTNMHITIIGKANMVKTVRPPMKNRNPLEIFMTLSLTS